MKIKKETWARTIVLILALVNQAFAIMGKGSIAITEETVYQLCSLVGTVVTALCAWWYNNSFSTPALMGDEYKAISKARDGDNRQDTEAVEGGKAVDN